MVVKKPKILYLDIETHYMEVAVWGLGEQRVGLDQILKDWELAAWSAVWGDDKKLMYQDRRKGRSEKELLKGVHKLLNECDILATQNGVRFDSKKLNAKFAEHHMTPPSSYRHIDTYKIGKKYFGFTSHKLEYMCEKLGLKYKKSKHKEFPGLELWKECAKGNLAAWKVMEDYNKKDILALRALHKEIQPWDGTINFNVYSDGVTTACYCGSTDFIKNGYCYGSTGKYQRYSCKQCGAESQSKKNELSKEKRASLRPGVK
jgi:uncharacterized protein YprB with RNaseH-like and TPR domain